MIIVIVIHHFHHYITISTIITFIIITFIIITIIMEFWSVVLILLSLGAIAGSIFRNQRLPAQFGVG